MTRGCSFLEEDLKTTPLQKLTFRDSTKIIELAERCVGFKNLAERQALDHEIEIGRGGIWLNLTTEQYAKLAKPQRALRSGNTPQILRSVYLDGLMEVYPIGANLMA